MVVFTDASFPNSRGLKRKLGYLILPLDDEKRANIILLVRNDAVGS